VAEEEGPGGNAGSRWGSGDVVYSASVWSGIKFWLMVLMYLNRPVALLY
jgi:hypothetical protein